LVSSRSIATEPSGDMSSTSSCDMTTFVRSVFASSFSAPKVSWLSVIASSSSFHSGVAPPTMRGQV
jgi:hypothetical protein